MYTKKEKIWKFWTNQFNSFNGHIVKRIGDKVLIRTENNILLERKISSLYDFSLTSYNLRMRTRH